MIASVPSWAKGHLTYRKLDFWARQGYLNPEGGSGSGDRRIWPESEQQVALTMAQLVRHTGMNLKTAHEIARNVRAHRAEGMIGPVMVQVAGGIYVTVHEQFFGGPDDDRPADQ